MKIRKTERGAKKGINRDRSTINRLKMYNERPLRDKKGRILYQAFQSKDTSHEARIEPNRRWFGPSRTVTSKELETFREELTKHQKQPYSVVIKSSKIPYSLLKDPVKEGKVNLLDIESFNSTFGKKSTRKRPRMSSNTIEELAKSVSDKEEKYVEEKDPNIKLELDYRLEKKIEYFLKVNLQEFGMNYLKLLILAM